LLKEALAKEKVQQNADAAAVAVAAQGITKAAELLSRTYTLVATNVPYLGRGEQAELLYDFCERHYSAGKGDIATVFLERSFNWITQNSAIALVTPWNWLFLTTYTSLRQTVLRTKRLRFVVRLGEKAFESPQAAGAFAALTILQSGAANDRSLVSGVDVSEQPTTSVKAQHLASDVIECIAQKKLLSNPDHVISTRPLSAVSLLGSNAQCYQGTSTGDNPRHVICFWELPRLEGSWEPFQVAPEETAFFYGRHLIVRWDEVEKAEGAAIRGEPAWCRRGIAIGQMRSLPATLYTGNRFSNTTPVIIPDNEQNLPALWHFCTSSDFFNALRTLNPKLSVDNGYVGKIAFDLSRWTAIAEAAAPIPEPYSDDPTQWLFKGDITSSTDHLQVAVARLLGYRWPEQPKEHDSIDTLADKDGIVCIPAVRGERPASERLLDLLRTAYGSQWCEAVLHKLLTDVGCRPGTSIDDWLRDKFFEQHCKRFHNRPFIWHIWDARRDGFSCLVNYHKLNHKRLETLTYSYLQDWITAQTAAAKSGKLGADLRLAAAQELQNKLKLILEADAPYDVFVRWKPIHEQPIGWQPDPNDGVRVNIRPFMTADVLRKNPNISWKEDRGKEPEWDKDKFPWFWKDGEFTGDRINDHHLTNAQKRAAREKAEAAK